MHSQKPIIVITHERSGTHLVINCINYDTYGSFYTVGYTPEKNNFNLKSYKHITYKDVMTNAYISNSVSKSHHQIQFMEDYLDFLFNKYHIIYVKRNIYDVLCSYYKFIQNPSEIGFPKINEWIFSKPNDIGKKFLTPYAPDPHIIIEPKNYIHRWLLHTTDWLKHKDKMLVLNYEDMLLDYPAQKYKIENYIKKRIADKIPNVHDKSLPNFGPVRGIIGAHKEIISKELIDAIDNYILAYDPK